MIQALAMKITKYMECLGMCTEDFEIHCYGIEVIISTVVDSLFIIILGIVCEHFIEALIYILAFWIIRKFGGGYHCQTYLKCLSLHVLLFAIYLLTYQYYERLMIFIYLFAIVTFLFLSPIRNRELAHQEYLHYKIISFTILCLFMIMAYLRIYANILTYVILIVTLLMIACIRKYEIKIV